MNSNADRDAHNGALGASVVHLLHRAGQRAGDIFGNEMRTSGLTPRQYAVLVTVAHHEGASQTKLVDLTGIDRSTLADVIARMLKKGLLRRRRARGDARAYWVGLTESGQKALARAEPIAAAADERVLAALPSDHHRELLAALCALAKTDEPVDPPA